MRRFLKLVALYLFHIGFVRPLVYYVMGTRFRRRNLLPRGPCIVVSNHNSHIDAALLMTLFPLSRLRQIHPVAAADYFGKNVIRRTAALTLMNGIPIERVPVRGEDPLEPVIEALDRGDSLIFFPEGSRGEAGVVARFRPGIGRLVKTYPGLLVVPVFMSGPERVLPRGETVPVPMNIDIQVGRPRSYPTHLESREIAERVRNDVLALAPPPPPVPGPRPSRPLRVAICGVEAELRHEVFTLTTRLLGRHARTIGLSEPVVEADEDGVREATGGIPITRKWWWPSFLAMAFRTSGVFRGHKFAEMVDRARIDEALEDGRLARYVVGDGSALVDVLAWAEAEFYKGKFDERGTQQLMRYLSGQLPIPLGRWWRFIRKAPEVWLLNTFDLARPQVPDLLVLLKVFPHDAMARIRSRGRPLAHYENERFLGELQTAYDTASQVIRKRGRVSILPLEVGAEPRADRLAERIVETVREFQGNPDTTVDQEAGTK